MDDEQLGLLGSLVYGGIVMISLFVGHLFLICNAKILIILAISFMSISLLLFTISFEYP